ncbi:MAG: hypothetical protein ACRC8S_16420 [Fimbriiglobus sp.]
MSRKLALFAVGIVILAPGCMGIQPVGPMTKVFGTASAAPKKVAPGITATEPMDAPEGSTMVPAPPPPSPTFLVTPGEVNSSNTNDALNRLRKEIEADTKALDQFPRYAEVSKVSRN